jgi:hypothetical protein
MPYRFEDMGRNPSQRKGYVSKLDQKLEVKRCLMMRVMPLQSAERTVRCLRRRVPEVHFVAQQSYECLPVYPYPAAISV